MRASWLDECWCLSFGPMVRPAVDSIDMRSVQMSDGSVGLAEIARVFLKIGAMSYGGPAIAGILQTEIQERRNWISKEEFVEGLALVNMLPGPLVTQLGIFIGHAKRGLAGGVLAGLCFLLPPFAIMLTLAAAYAAFGTLPAMRNAFYGIGPVILGLYAVAVYRLGRGIIKDPRQVAILVGAIHADIPLLSGAIANVSSR